MGVFRAGRDSERLLENGVTHVAMEATGIYWKPVWHVLSDYPLEVILANAAHVKNVPGRKTGVNDATWLAELAAHRLVRPPREVAVAWGPPLDGSGG